MRDISRVASDNMASNRTILTCAHRGIRLIMHSWGHNLCAMTRYMPWVFSSRDPGAIRDNQDGQSARDVSIAIYLIIHEESSRVTGGLCDVSQ